MMTMTMTTAATTLPGIGGSSIEDLDPVMTAAADFAGSPVMTADLDLLDLDTAETSTSLRSKRRRNHTTASFLSAVDSNIAAALDNIRLTAAKATLSSSISMLKGARVKRQKQSDMGQSVLDGFILSAGLDQRVLLWSLTGRCVGQFGCHDWDINSDATWFKEVQQDIAAKKRAAAQQGVTLRFDRNKTSACNIMPDTDIKDLVRSPSTRMLQADFGKKKKTASSSSSSAAAGHTTSHELNTYVVALSKKLAQKSAIYSDADEHFRHMLVRLLMHARPTAAAVTCMLYLPTLCMHAYPMPSCPPHVLLLCSIRISIRWSRSSRSPSGAVRASRGNRRVADTTREREREIDRYTMRMMLLAAASMEVGWNNRRDR